MSATAPTPVPSDGDVPAAATPKFVAAIRVFNEERFLPRWLDAISKLADEVVAIDDGSNDGSLDILRGHPIVTEVVAKKRGRQTDTQDHRRMTQMALDHGADWIGFLDADEMWDARIVDVLPRLLADLDVGEYKFRKPWLWRSEAQYRTDNPEKLFAWCLPRLVRASASLKWNYPENADWKRLAAVLIRQSSWRTSYAYGRLDGIPGPVVQVPPDEVVLLHYAAVDYHRLQWKHIRNAIHNAREYPKRDGDAIASHWALGLDESTAVIEAIPSEWKHLT